MTEAPPEWMTRRAADIANRHVRPEHAYHLAREILEAMQEAGQEVALYFAANLQRLPVKETT